MSILQSFKSNDESRRIGGDFDEKSVVKFVSTHPCQRNANKMRLMKIPEHGQNFT